VLAAAVKQYVSENWLYIHTYRISIAEHALAKQGPNLDKT
jgi:hypothetical protein